jgi:hypothetical protein
MNDKARSLVEAQLAMGDFAKYPEFEGNVAGVDTRGFWRESDVSPSSQGYHWNFNAETYFLLSDGMGREMIRLIDLIDPNVPSVDAGTSMVTWVGEPVMLAPTVDVPAGSDWTDLTYAWAAEGPNDVSVEFDPAVYSADPNTSVILNPTVTITKPVDETEAIVTLTLSVNNAGRLAPPVHATMTILVCDDACTATISKGLAADNPTDLDGNCITDLGDVAMLAAKWLTDHAFTEPVAK